MSFRAGLLVVLVILPLVGCGGTIDPSTVKGAQTASPHNGATIALPNGVGFAEFVDEETKMVRGKPVSAVLVVYFLNDDKTAPLATLPTDVTVAIGAGDAVKTVPLSPTPGPKAGDEFSSARFASKVGPHMFMGARGEISGSLNGQSFTLKFNNAR